MREWALIVLIFIALMAGGYRMDEQFSPSLKAVSRSYVKLSKAERAVLFFRNKAFRHRFLRAALTGALSLCYTGIGGRRVAAEVARATVSDVTSGVK